MIDFNCLGLRKGDNILVNSNQGKFYGKFDKISMKGMRLDVSEVKSYDGIVNSRFKFFFKNDVQSVQLLDEVSQEITQSTDSSDTKSTTGSQITTNQLGQIEDTIKNRVYIDMPDSKYAAALLDISKQYLIGIVAEGTKRGRVYDMKLLTISTFNKIYIFDVIALDAEIMMQEIKEILENDDILKIVHDSRGVKDNFKTKFDIKLETLDLMLIAAQTYSESKVISLGACIETVLGVKNAVKDNEILKERPFSSSCLEEAATKVAYHIAMYHKLVQRSFQHRFQQPSFENQGILNLMDGLSVKKLEMVLKNQSFLSDFKPIDYSIYSAN